MSSDKSSLQIQTMKVSEEQHLVIASDEQSTNKRVQLSWTCNKISNNTKILNQQSSSRMSTTVISRSGRCWDAPSQSGIYRPNIKQAATPKEDTKRILQVNNIISLCILIVNELMAKHQVIVSKIARREVQLEALKQSGAFKTSTEPVIRKRILKFDLFCLTRHTGYLKLLCTACWTIVFCKFACKFGTCSYLCLIKIATAIKRKFQQYYPIALL